MQKWVSITVSQYSSVQTCLKASKTHADVGVCVHYKPVVDGCTWISAVLGVDHQNGEHQEPQAHAEAEAVHGLVAHEHVAVDVSLDTRERGASAVLTEARNLESQCQR